MTLDQRIKEFNSLFYRRVASRKIKRYVQGLLFDSDLSLEGDKLWVFYPDGTSPEHLSSARKELYSRKAVISCCFIKVEPSWEI